MKLRVEKEIGGNLLWIETGEWAKQAHGSCVIGYGDTVVLSAATSAPCKPGTDFFPLTCDYRERAAAAGKFPGGFIKREGRPGLKEVLTSRLIDRPMRPLFPKGFFNEVQVLSFVLASDRTIDPDVLAMNGSAVAVELSPVPFEGPLGSVRLGLIDGQFVPFPAFDQLEFSDLDLVVSGNMDSVLMIEGFAREMPEPKMYEAILTAHAYIRQICELQNELIELVKPVKAEFTPPPTQDLYSAIFKNYYKKFYDAKKTTGKLARAEACQTVKDLAKDELLQKADAASAAVSTPVVEEPEKKSVKKTAKKTTKKTVKKEETAEIVPTENFTEELFEIAWDEFAERVVRDIILSKERLDGRGMEEVRPIECKINVLPRVHGSAVFQRGETQALITVTLGTARDEQKVDGLFDEYAKKFMLDYNFPPFSVGECKPLRGTGRREYGHGALAERSVKPILPEADDFPYTIRVVSDILESNGSSSMATVCGATLGLMSAGVPISNPVAGISVGLVKESNDEWVTITDIMGDEDHYGDMDFKVAGTQNGITGIQLDLKTNGISREIIQATLKQARKARIEILRKMLSAMPRPADQISSYAPRMLKTKIEPDKIGLLIGPGGKTIRAIQEATGASIDIDNDGTVFIAAIDSAGADAAMTEVNRLTATIEVGKRYLGEVTSIKEFGAFLQIVPGRDGLCHISELSDEYVDNIHNFCKIGDKFEVKVIAIDDANRIKLSRKAVLIEDKASTEEN